MKPIENPFELNALLAKKRELDELEADLRSRHPPQGRGVPDRNHEAWKNAGLGTRPYVITVEEGT